MLLVFVVGLLMVSTWRFWSGKEISFTDRHPFQQVVVIGLVIYATVAFSQIVLFLVAFFYMFSGIFARAAYSWQRRHKAANRQLTSPEAVAVSEPSSAPPLPPSHPPSQPPVHP
jgi:CDP-diacylglycerol--serine O-phosphatidyltransferase